MSKKDLIENKKLGQSGPSHEFLMRVYHRKESKVGSGIRSARYLLKCGCCDEKVEIYYGGGSLEINGVNGSVENWRAILLPLLK
jgi:hypothetical protein